MENSVFTYEKVSSTVEHDIEMSSLTFKSLVTGTINPITGILLTIIMPKAQIKEVFRIAKQLPRINEPTNQNTQKKISWAPNAFQRLNFGGCLCITSKHVFYLEGQRKANKRCSINCR